MREELARNGNKADLVARLQEDDKKKAGTEAQTAEDEIDYSDDDVAITTKNPEPAAEPEKPEAAQADAPAETEKGTEAPSTEGATAEGANGEAASADDAAVENFALNLPPTLAEDEVKKRADRAKRFGLVDDDDERKKSDRAKRFGIDNSTLAKSLDSALPDRPSSAVALVKMTEVMATRDKATTLATATVGATGVMDAVVAAETTTVGTTTVGATVADVPRVPLSSLIHRRRPRRRLVRRGSGRAKPYDPRPFLEVTIAHPLGSD
ncbi:unnamed protein product [Parascedosporium putredinis]|uniref:THO1-MOS11 C-terminal domain-containing protein n=1 Tax=Parascedosporium putredinis TaxID=1442378 RepID=A0A9P1H011_9PEZI|nr:unnamed protein product [Parascedosporium putredinis]CAI7991294.1 unnamed protein product [Parascedosporium putredinis]